MLPVVIPLTMPVRAPTVAMPGFALVQLPPVVVLLSVVVVPAHTSALPVIDGSTGMVVTVSCAVTLAGQPKILVTV